MSGTERRRAKASKISIPSAGMIFDPVGVVIDVDPDLATEEIGECAVREVEDLARAHAKQFVDDFQFDGSQMFHLSPNAQIAEQPQPEPSANTQRAHYHEAGPFDRRSPLPARYRLGSCPLLMNRS